MVPMTDTGADKAVESFYDALASDYDAMTDMEKRFVAERPFFHMLVDRHQIGCALDAGCGTGFHSFLLARLGVSVTGVDMSGAMVEKARQHAQRLGVDVRFVQSRFQDLGSTLGGQFDAVVCMGNSLAHLLSRDDLGDALHAFETVLHPGGILFAQVLNYERILRDRERVQSIREKDGAMYVRYYEYCGELIQFHILKLIRSGSDIEHSLNTVTLRPILGQELVSAIEVAGFEKVGIFGGIAMEAFDPATSKDLVLLAHKKGGDL